MKSKFCYSLHISLFTYFNYFNRSDIQCSAWCTDYDECRAFRWEVGPKICTLFEDNGVCQMPSSNYYDNHNDSIKLFVETNKNQIGDFRVLYYVIYVNYLCPSIWNDFVLQHCFNFRMSWYWSPLLYDCICWILQN